MSYLICSKAYKYKVDIIFRNKVRGKIIEMDLSGLRGEMGVEITKVKLKPLEREILDTLVDEQDPKIGAKFSTVKI